MVPICIQSTDRHGNEIAPVWFEQGVAPIHDELISLAHYGAGDPWLASELTETSVHKLWGDGTGRKCRRDTLAQGVERSILGSERYGRRRLESETVPSHLSDILEQLDQEFPDKTVDPTDYGHSSTNAS